MTAEGFAAQAATDFPGHSEDFLKLYPHANDQEALNSASDYAGDRFIAYGTWKWLDAQVATGKSPVYRYLFALANPGDRYHTPAVGAFHSDDIEYVFGTLDSRPEAVWRPEDRKLSNEIQKLLDQLRPHRRPQRPRPPQVAHLRPDQWQIMHLDATSARQTRHPPRPLPLPRSGLGQTKRLKSNPRRQLDASRISHRRSLSERRIRSRGIGSRSPRAIRNHVIPMIQRIEGFGDALKLHPLRQCKGAAQASVQTKEVKPNSLHCAQSPLREAPPCRDSTPHSPSS